MPVFNSEVNYEALLDLIPAEIVRLMFWPSVLSGAAGHTYGANGIWQCNRRDEAHGASPHGGNYGKIAWNEAMHLPGSSQLAAAKRLLEEYPWYALKPSPEGAAWEARDGDSAHFVPYAADLGSEVRMVYIPEARPIRVRKLDTNAAYRTTLFDPVTGARESLPDSNADANGEIRFSAPSHGHDWVVVLETLNKP